MKHKWSWWRAWLVQVLEMLVLGAIVSLAEVLGNTVYSILTWAVVPLLGAVSAYRTTLRGLNNYLAWLAPPVCTVAVHLLIWTYFPEPGPVMVCLLISIVGAAAGEVMLREQAKEQKHG